MSLTDRLHALDRRQQRSPRLGFVVAVAKKFNDDQAGQLAALISYYAFVSLFPLLLVFVTILGFVLQGNPGEQHKILDGTLGQVPIIRDQLKLHSLTGSTVALVIGIVLSLLAGMGITNATQNALNRIWAVPFKHRPDFLHSRLRSLGMLAVLGTLSIVSAVVGGFVGSSSHPALTVVGGVLVAFVFNLALFMLAFKLLTAADLSWRELLPGVVTASVFWQRLLRRPRAQTPDPAVWRVRARARPARLAVPRRPAHDLRSRGQRRAPPPPVAAQPVQPPDRRRQARAKRCRGGPGARSRAERRGQLRRARVGLAEGPPQYPRRRSVPTVARVSGALAIPYFRLCDAVSGVPTKLLAHATTSRYTN
jgi:YihY family inner membrane protein